MRAQSFSRVCGPMDCNLPGSSVHGIFQARVLERVAISYSRDLPSSGNKPVSPAPPILAARFFTTVPPGRPRHLFRHSEFIAYIIFTTAVHFADEKSEA